MAFPNGGLTAPEPPKIGLGSARRPRSVNRRQTPRGEKIQKAVSEQQRARTARNGGVTVDGSNRGVDPGYGRPPLRPRPARQPGPIGEAVNTDLGAQLSRRVSSGAIDQSQAEQVAKDRATLEQAYGPDWRDKVFGGTGRVQRLRKTVSEHGTNELGAKARLGQLLAKRKSFLEKARSQAAEPR